MKALTLYQPWASLVGLGAKQVETRPWSTRYRGPLAIHASVRCETGEFGRYEVEDDTPRRSAKQYLLRGPLAWPYRLPLGAVVATCRLVEVVPSERVTLAPETVTGWRPRDGGFEADEEQFELGDLTPGRFAWLLADVQPITAVAARGRQQLWNWEETT